MRKLSYLLLVGLVALLAAPAEAVVEAVGGPKGRPVVCENNGEVCTTPLIAGQTMVIGEVSVSRDTGELVVTYVVTDPAWSITEIQFEVSSAPIEEYAPGQYYYKFDGLNTQFYQFVAEDHGPNDVCYFAAHAVVTEVIGYEPGPVDLEWFAYNLPDQVQMTVNQPPGSPGYFKTTVNINGSVSQYDGWCIDVQHFITPGTNYTANVYSSYEDLPGDINIDKPWNLPYVNYVINNYTAGDPSPSGGNYTPCDIQRAIWYFIDDGTTGCGTYSQTRVNEIVADAEANGAGFVPDCNQKIAVILVPVDGSQVTIAQVTIIEVLLECGDIPVLGYGTETAWGCGYKIRENKNWGWYFHCGTCASN